MHACKLKFSLGMFGLGDLGTGFLNRHISGHTVYVLEVNINEKLVMRELNS